jgi:hypothetical protein
MTGLIKCLLSALQLHSLRSFPSLHTWSCCLLQAWQLPSYSVLPSLVTKGGAVSLTNLLLYFFLQARFGDYCRGGAFSKLINHILGEFWLCQSCEKHLSSNLFLETAGVSGSLPESTVRETSRWASRVCLCLSASHRLPKFSPPCMSTEPFSPIVSITLCIKWQLAPYGLAQVTAGFSPPWGSCQQSPSTIPTKQGIPSHQVSFLHLFLHLLGDPVFLIQEISL